MNINQKKKITRLYLLLISILVIGCYHFVWSATALKNQKYLSVKSKPRFGVIEPEKGKILILSDKETEKKFFFTFIKDIEADSIGNIYVLDKVSIMKFDTRGKFIGTISSQGEGPGEIRTPKKLFVDSNDNLYISDYRNIVIFDKNGKYKKAIKPDFNLTGKIFVDDEECIYGFRREIGKNGVEKVLVKLDIQGNLIKRIGRFMDKATKVKQQNGGGVMGGVRHAYSHDVYFCPVGKEGLCVAENTVYKLNIFGFNGNQIRTISSEERPISITSEDMDKFKQRFGRNIKNIVFPPHRPFIQRLLSDNRGRIYVVRQSSIADEDKIAFIDVYSILGDYLYKIKSEFNPFFIKYGYWYTIVEDEENDLVIKRLKIKKLPL